MNIGLFGGTFDPIHRGHTALAKAAEQQFRLSRIEFVTANVPPHKRRQPLSPYLHRHAMVALATAGDKTWIPSILEAPDELAETTGKRKAPEPNYSIDSIRRLKKTLKTADQLFFLIGIDAFRDIAKWHRAEELFAECKFIVASRPGFSLADIANSLPESIRPADHVTRPFEKQAAKGDLVLPQATVHLLDSVHHAISATAVRQAVAHGKPLAKLVEPSVAAYIKKMRLYK